VEPLLGWFATNARDLPWRRTSDPYAIWVSEVMLQQTQVKTVVPYWERWVRVLPTVQALARARPEKVLKLWEGLGYYTRARNLRRAAKVIVERSGGRFPEELNEVLSLPGVGRYTAGAICSIAFNQPTPVLDGNVTRVLTRVFGIARDPREREATALLWRLAEELVQHAAAIQRDGERHCSALNQALMELGAVVCTPRQPRCDECPLRSRCVARRANRMQEIPNLGRRASTTERRFAAFVVERRGRFLVRQRPTGVVNAGLWEFPNVEVRNGAAEVERLATELFGGKPTALRHVGRVKHTITRYRIRLDIYRTEMDGRAGRRLSRKRWLTMGELRRLALPSAHRRISALIEGGLCRS
jgi:A/G-specific adenine glycosylase